MFGKIFRRCKSESDSKSSSSQMLKQTLEMLEQKESVLQKKVDVEVERAKEFTKSRNKQAAMQCLKRKKFYESQLEQLGSFQSQIHDQEQKMSHKPVNPSQMKAGNRVLTSGQKA